MHSGKQHGLEDCYNKFLKSEYKLVLLPDAGSNDYEYHKILKDKDIAVICLDHHIKEEDTIVPQNMIIVNNQTSNYYINKDLSGAGVTWQFCRYIDS